jgi:hypothetical protein
MSAAAKKGTPSRFYTAFIPHTLLTLLQMLFFGSKCERLCMMQFALVSLIPGLVANLQDAADPTLDTYALNVQRVATLRTSDRNSRTLVSMTFWRTRTSYSETDTFLDSGRVYGVAVAALWKGKLRDLENSLLIITHLFRPSST